MTTASFPSGTQKDAPVPWKGECNDRLQGDPQADGHGNQSEGHRRVCRMQQGDGARGAEARRGNVQSFVHFDSSIVPR